MYANANLKNEQKLFLQASENSHAEAGKSVQLEVVANKAIALLITSKEALVGVVKASADRQGHNSNTVAYKRGRNQEAGTRMGHSRRKRTPFEEDKHIGSTGPSRQNHVVLELRK